jgi:hypothetical protein
MRINLIPVLKMNRAHVAYFLAAGVYRTIINIFPLEVWGPFPSLLKVVWELIINKTSIKIDSITLVSIINYLECH